MFDFAYFVEPNRRICLYGFLDELTEFCISVTLFVKDSEGMEWGTVFEGEGTVQNLTSVVEFIVLQIVNLVLRITYVSLYCL
jgi:hypothetical protein